MRQRILYRSLLTGLLVLSLTPRGYARRKTKQGSQGIVLTVVALDPKTHTATFRADDGGKEFQVTNSTSWKTGAKVLCDLVERARRARSSSIVSRGKRLLPPPAPATVRPHMSGGTPCL